MFYEIFWSILIGVWSSLSHLVIHFSFSVGFQACWLSCLSFCLTNVSLVAFVPFSWINSLLVFEEHLTLLLILNYFRLVSQHQLLHPVSERPFLKPRSFQITDLKIFPYPCWGWFHTTLDRLFIACLSLSTYLLNCFL